VTSGALVQAAVDNNLKKFEEHKQALLIILSNAYIPGPTAQRFDEMQAWFHLTNIAGSFFLGAQVKQAMMPWSDRVARLRSLANALRDARSLIDRAMDDDIGDELYSAWCNEIDQPQAEVIRNENNSFGLARPPLEIFKKIVAGVSGLEAAAVRALDETQNERATAGRPTGTAVLPPGFILALASAYRTGTNARPLARNGPFPRFVRGFLDATGHKGRPSERHLLEMIEAECAHVRANPSGWAPSPFD